MVPTRADLGVCVLFSVMAQALQDRSFPYGVPGTCDRAILYRTTTLQIWVCPRASRQSGSKNTEARRRIGTIDWAGSPPARDLGVR